MQLRLVALPPDASYSRTAQSTALEKAAAILKTRGDQPRQRQNRLIFLAADMDTVRRLKDQVRSMLAWQSIVDDYEQDRLNLDSYQKKQASQSLETARETVGRVIRDAYKWVLAPMQDARPGGGVSDIQWEHFSLNASAQNLAGDIERVLKENELLISEWAPIHLSKVLKDWFWKPDTSSAAALDVWQKSCCYLYLPRLADERVFLRTLAVGSASADFFGLAYGNEDGRFLGLTIGEVTTPILDTTLLLVEPSVAKAQTEAMRVTQPVPTGNFGGATGGTTSVTESTGSTTETPSGAPVVPAKNALRRFYGNVDINPVTASMSFSDIVTEVVEHFTSKLGTRVTISVEINASTNEGFDDNLRRIVNENCRMLKFKSAEFEE